MDIIIPDHMRKIMEKLRPHIIDTGADRNRVYEALVAWRQKQIDEFEIAIDENYDLKEKEREK